MTASLFVVEEIDLVLKKNWKEKSSLMDILRMNASVNACKNVTV